MTVHFVYPKGGEGWEKQSPLVSVIVPRVGDIVTGPDHEEYIVKRVHWLPWGATDDLNGRTLVILRRADEDAP